MIDYNEGDLVEVAKGEHVIRGRVALTRQYMSRHIPMPGIDDDDQIHLLALEQLGYVVTVIEKAKPKVALPTKPGTIITWSDDAYLPQIAQLDAGDMNCGWRHNRDVDGHWYTADEMAAVIDGAAFTILEPRAATAIAVFAAIDRSFIPGRDRLLTYDGARAIARQFGVADD